ncbi:hypothetical protein SDC9_163433 [bioreactor metagenome]|uniref:Uncharacterized protein n=1 Tax=bioreactor metagenome TaxID=1076179 RepID=A0A645FNU2_9ZZZZ
MLEALRCGRYAKNKVNRRNLAVGASDKLLHHRQPIRLVIAVDLCTTVRFVNNEIKAIRFGLGRVSDGVPDGVDALVTPARGQ